MDGVALIAEAHAAGLTIRLDGDRLVVRGPRSAEATAQRLLARKAAVVSALRGEAATPPTAGQHAEGRADGTLAGTMFEGWCPHAAPDGTVVWLPPNAPEPALKSVVAVLDLSDQPPEAIPACPRCDSLELWQDGLGAWHCIPCDRERFDRARRLAERLVERVERIRRRARLASKTGPQEPRPCVAAGQVDT